MAPNLFFLKHRMMTIFILGDTKQNTVYFDKTIEIDTTSEIYILYMIGGETKIFPLNSRVITFI